MWFFVSLDSQAKNILLMVGGNYFLSSPFSNKKKNPKYLTDFLLLKEINFNLTTTTTKKSKQTNKGPQPLPWKPQAVNESFHPLA